MGSACCCLRPDDRDDPADPADFVFRYCICLRCLTHQFVNAYGILFQRRAHIAPSSLQRAGSLASDSLVDSSIPDTYRSPPRPLAYDDPRCSRLQRGRLGATRAKGCYEESEPLRSSSSNSNIESMSSGEKWNGSDHEGGSKLCSPDTSLNPSKVLTSATSYFFPSSEDEDGCPTCLEEYTSENPKIILQCSHHFHLGCIYEWMERSEACPVCGKVMMFNEAA